jgi:hypothetical protein
MDLKFSLDAYFAPATIVDIVAVSAATTTAQTVTTPASTATLTTPPATTSLPTTTPAVTLTADPSVQNQINTVNFANFTAVDLVVNLVISTLSPSLSPIEAQALIEAMLLKLLAAVKLLQPASKVIPTLKKFLSNAVTLSWLTGKGLGAVVDIVAALTSPLELAYGNDIVWRKKSSLLLLFHTLTSSLLRLRLSVWQLKVTEILSVLTSLAQDSLR